MMVLASLNAGINVVGLVTSTETAGKSGPVGVVSSSNSWVFAGFLDEICTGR